MAESLPLVFEGVEKRFGQTVVLSGVDFSTEPGEFIVLVGPSGCGKSTLLRCVAGLETISRGRIMAGDRVLNHLPPQDRGVGMVFQSYALYPHMTVAQNLAFPLLVRKASTSEQERVVADVAAMLGLEPLLRRYPRQISGGQRQRVAIGRCLVRKPEIYCFDEPLSNLDAALRAQIRVDIKNLQRRLRKTTLYVTHDQVEAMTLADRIVVLDKGIVQQIGSPEELYTRPANRFVARFIGTPSMNLVRGQVAHGMFSSGELKVRVARPDGPLVLGVRVEDVQILGGPGAAEPGAGEDPVVVPARIAVIEPVGESGYLHLDVAGAALEGDVQPGAPGSGSRHLLVASVPGRAVFSYSLGQDVSIRLNPRRCRAFHPESGAALSVDSGGDA